MKNRRGVVVIQKDGQHPFDRTLADIWHETDEFSLTDQTRGQRKAIKERRKAHEKAQKHQNKS